MLLSRLAWLQRGLGLASGKFEPTAAHDTDILKNVMSPRHVKFADMTETKFFCTFDQPDLVNTQILPNDLDLNSTQYLTSENRTGIVYFSEDQVLMLELIKAVTERNANYQGQKINLKNVAYDSRMSDAMRALISAYNEESEISSMFTFILGKWIEKFPDLVGPTGPLIQDLCAAAKGRNPVFKFVLDELDFSPEIIKACLSYGVDARSLGTSLGLALEESYYSESSFWLDIACLLKILLLKGFLTICQTAAERRNVARIVFILQNFAILTNNESFWTVLAYHSPGSGKARSHSIEDEELQKTDMEPTAWRGTGTTDFDDAVKAYAEKVGGFEILTQCEPDVEF